MSMEVAHIIAKQGTCDRLQVGAVVHRNSRIISTGYNGVPSGLPHCNHAAEQPVVGEERGCQLAVHAEANAIAFAAKHGLRIDGADLTVTHMPCVDCAKLIINAGLVSVTYEQPYRKLEGVQLLTRAKIRVVELHE
jgi:dCMP deaminase